MTQPVVPTPGAQSGETPSGRWVSSANYSEMQLAHIQACLPERWRVDERGFGFVWEPTEFTEEEAERIFAMAERQPVDEEQLARIREGVLRRVPVSAPEPSGERTAPDRRMTHSDAAVSQTFANYRRHSQHDEPSVSEPSGETQSVDHLSRSLRCEEYTVREMWRPAAVGADLIAFTQVTTYDDDTRNWIIRTAEGATLTEALQHASLGEWAHEAVTPHEPPVSEPSGAGMPETDDDGWTPEMEAAWRVLEFAFDDKKYGTREVRAARDVILSALNDRDRLTRERAEAVQAAERSDRILLDRMMDAALAREDEREACALLMESAHERWGRIDAMLAWFLAEEIRARSTPATAAAPGAADLNQVHGDQV